MQWYINPISSMVHRLEQPKFEKMDDHTIIPKLLSTIYMQHFGILRS